MNLGSHPLKYTQKNGWPSDPTPLTTMRFHILAASATSVETELQPGMRMILMGSL